MKKFYMPEDVTASKRPETKEHHLGIEIEFICEYTEEVLSGYLALSPLAKFVTLKSDGSIRPYICRSNNCYGCDRCDNGGDGEERCHELAVCVPQSKLGSVMRELGDFFRRIGARTNRSCGLHVHLDMRGRDPKKAYANLYRVQDVLYGMNPASRRHNQYSRPSSSNNFDDAQRQGKYQGINASAYGSYETLEVRIATGTVNVKDIEAWAKVLIAAADKGLTKRLHSSTEMVKALKLSRPLAKYVKEKTAKYASRR